MAQTFGALAYGPAHYGAPLPSCACWPTGSARRATPTCCAKACRRTSAGPARWRGDAAASLPERHLGLFSADELPDLIERLDRMADALEALPISQLPPAVSFRRAGAAAPHSGSRSLAHKTVAIARDDAFRFIYPANVDTLFALGANVVWFSPLRDRALPACDALWLPGGYPELHGATLAANADMRAALRRAHADGLPILAECGGMMALFDTLVDKEGVSHQMAGLLPGTVTMQRRLAAIGHQAVTLPGVMGEGGEGGRRGQKGANRCAAIPSTIRRPIRRWNPQCGRYRRAMARRARRSTRPARSRRHTCICIFRPTRLAIAALLGGKAG